MRPLKLLGGKVPAAKAVHYARWHVPRLGAVECRPQGCSCCVPRMGMFRVCPTRDVTPRHREAQGPRSILEETVYASCGEGAADDAFFGNEIIVLRLYGASHGSAGAKDAGNEKKEKKITVQK